MACPDHGEKPAGRRRPGIIMAACTAVFLFLTVGCSSRESWTPERVEGVLQQSASVELFQAVKAGFPDDYRHFLEREVEVAGESSEYAITSDARRLAELLMASHFDGLARAPDADLVEIARQHVELLRTLRRVDMSQCTHFLAHGDLEARGAPQEAAAAILSHIQVLMLRAAAAGDHGSPVTRAPLTPEERQALLREAARRSPEAAPLLANPGGIQAAPNEQQCAAGAAVYEAIASLPPDMAAKAIISLLRPPPASGGASGQ